MKKIAVSSLIIFVFIMTSCTSPKKIEPEDEFAVEAEVGGEDIKAASGDLSLDNLAEKPATENNSDANLESELNSLSTEEPQPSTPVKDELSLDEPVQKPVAQDVPPPEIPQPELEPVVPPAPVVQEAPPPPVIQEAPPPAAKPAKTARIHNLIYQTNSNGGTVVISADQPLKYVTRFNSATNQFVVEVENSTIPDSLKRPLNTKDMASTIGSVDIYQKGGSNITRFVVQLRPKALEPIIQPEGNSLLIIGAGVDTVAKVVPSAANSDQIATQEKPEADVVDLASEGIMSSDDLEEFLINNNKFYGKKINIETTQTDIREALKFIAEESGVNMIIDDGVTGTVSVKLKAIPWDQALILILKTKNLGFKRQGSVLRIGKVEDFKRAEEEAIAMKADRQVRAPQIVKRFFIGYANIDEIAKQISDHLTQTTDSGPAPSGSRGGAGGASAVQSSARQSVGKVMGDKRTNTLIVTDTEENMVKITKLIEALDTQPQQVLIEGKVVEAKESFTRGLGVTWNSQPSQASTTNRARIGIRPILDAGAVVLDSDFTWGQLDVLGTLNAQLQLGEREDKVRVLSAPRIAVLSNESATISQTAGLLIPVSTTTNGVTTVSNQIVDFGVTLKVTPLVSNEGTITLTLDIDRSFLARVDADAPEKRNAKTKVIVKSGQTEVIGGIFESETRSATSGVPGLKDIPILGRLFRSDAEGKSKNELVIFVTPTILKPVVGAGKNANSIVK